MLELRLKQNPQVRQQMPELEAQVLNNQTTPYNAAQKIIDLL